MGWQLDAFYRSAREVVNLWANVRNRSDTRSRRYLRWTPQHAFDVFNYEPNDDDRTVHAKDEQYSLCRTRSGHKLGYVREGVCVLVEAAPTPNTDPVQVEVYHSGRCLTGNSRRERHEVVQSGCEKEANQFWYFRPTGGVTGGLSTAILNCA
jgi:hypothetical protein